MCNFDNLAYYSPVLFESTVRTLKIRRLKGLFFPFVDSKGLCRLIVSVKDMSTYRGTVYLILIVFG